MTAVPSEPPAPFVPTARTTVRRHRDRASYDRAVVEAILDEGFICHVACAVDGTPWMIPTAYGRRGDELLLHGAVGNHVLRAAASGAEICVTVTLLDGLVLARSVMHHSLNYRSVVLFGRAVEISEPREKEAALAAIVEHMLPGRTQDARSPSDEELRATRVVTLPIDEVSAKVRTGGPVDDPADVGLDVWAGVLPLRVAAGPAEPDRPGAASAGSPSYLAQPARWA
jgi:nitroimidazol reductase NimA-like FMN-containing flavoprotein (pyridoxamine 5'-phosphate oxidase superfamily)